MSQDTPKEGVPKRQRHECQCGIAPSHLLDHQKLHYDMLELLPAEPVIWQGSTPLAESIAVQSDGTQRLRAERARLQNDRKTLQASRRLIPKTRESEKL